MRPTEDPGNSKAYLIFRIKRQLQSEQIENPARKACNPDITLKIDGVGCRMPV
jgi:hypothetical protein